MLNHKISSCQVSGLAPLAVKTIENQRETSLRSRPGGLTIGVATGIKIERDLTILPLAKSSKMKFELQIKDRPLIMTKTIINVF